MVSIYSHLAGRRLIWFFRKHSTLNIQRPTLKKRVWRKVLDVECWTLNVECFPILKRLLCVFLFLPAATFLQAADTDAPFNKWFEVQTNLHSWSADFSQTRTLKVLNQPLVSTGRVWVTPGEFRWELGQPVQTIVLRQPDQLLIIYPRLRQAEKYPLGAVPTGPIKDALALLDATLPRDRATMEKNFHLLSATETNSMLLMTLQPRSDSARQFISEILIGFHTNDFTIAATEMKFADGSTLRNDFTNVILNQPIDPTEFEAKLPPDFTVVEPLKQ
jgi:outer membrane lipoprotein-sorting protein